MRLGIIVGPIVFLLWLFCVIDVIMSRDEECEHLPKVAWLLIVLFFPLVGSLAWLLIGRSRGSALPWHPRGRAAMPSSSPYPEYDRPGRMLPADPAADEAFLRQCRERAEEQRRRYREEKERRLLDGDESG